MKFPVKNKIMLGGIVSVVALALTGWLSNRALTRSTATAELVTHTHEVITSLESVLASLTQVEAEQRGYLLTGATNFLGDHRLATMRLHESMAHLQKLVADNPKQQQHLDKLRPMVAERLALSQERIATFQEFGLEAAADAVALGKGKAVMDQIRRTIGGMDAEESRLLTERVQASEATTRSSLAIITGSSVLAILVSLLAVIIIRHDLKLRELAERELQETKALLESILDHTPAIVFVKDIEGRYLFVNRHFAQVAGRSRAEIQGKTAFDLFSRDTAERANAHQQTVLARQGPVEFEETVQHPDGPRPHLAVKFPLRDATGKIYATAGISTDITERKKAEEERDRFFSLSLDLLCIAHADGYFKRISPAVTEMLGWSAEEFLARPFLDFVHPDDHAPTLQEVEKQIKSGQRVLQFENRYRHKDGSWRVLSWCSMPQGELMYAIARDVTQQNAAAEQIVQLNAALQNRATQLEATNQELKRSRAELQGLFESLPGLYLVLKLDFKIIAVSDAYLKATMTTREQIIGRGLFDVFPDNPDDPKATGVTNLRQSLNQVLQTGEPNTMAIQKYDVRRPDGTFEERFWSPINSPVHGADRKIEYIIHRVEDVTEFVQQRQHLAQPEAQNNALRARMELMEAEVFKSSQQVQATNQQLLAANKELEAFSYSVSHDLRAPLRHIDGFVDLLAKQNGDKLDERGQRYLKIIAGAARQMSSLIDDLLVFSRMGRAEVRRQTVDLDALVHEAVAALQTDLAGRNITWKIATLPQVKADAVMLRQVLVNLIANAVKYSRPRDPAVIEIGCAPGTPTEYEFFVRDNGVGFDMEYVDKLFGVFQRLHRSEEFEGTGIGLANVRRIIQRHGGRVWAEGKVDAGATFHFTLPQTPRD